jgi:hypothetical protein
MVASGLRVHITHLLDALEDPFETFPMQSVAEELSRIADRDAETPLERDGPVAYNPRSPYAVEGDHDIAVEQLLIGSDKRRSRRPSQSRQRSTN